MAQALLFTLRTEGPALWRRQLKTSHACSRTSSPNPTGPPRHHL